jgi:hypothetical protein
MMGKLMQNMIYMNMDRYNEDFIRPQAEFMPKGRSNNLIYHSPSSIHVAESTPNLIQMLKVFIPSSIPHVELNSKV